MTPFSDVYKRFLRKIRDIQLALKLSSEDTIDIAEELMFGWLESACVKFMRCNKDLFDIDTVKGEFNLTLSSYEQEILALLMSVEWITGYVNDVLSLEPFLDDKEFKTFSQSAFLDSKVKVKRQLIDEAETLINRYTYETANLSLFR